MQALDVIRQLKEAIPIERAKMRLRVVLPKKEAKRIKDMLTEKLQVEAEEWDDGDMELIGTVDPGDYRAVEELVRTESKGKAVLEVLTVQAIEEAL